MDYNYYLKLINFKIFLKKKIKRKIKLKLKSYFNQEKMIEAAKNTKRKKHSTVNWLKNWNADFLRKLGSISKLSRRDLQEKIETLNSSDFHLKKGRTRKWKPPWSTLVPSFWRPDLPFRIRLPLWYFASTTFFFFFFFFLLFFLSA